MKMQINKQHAISAVLKQGAHLRYYFEAGAAAVICPGIDIDDNHSANRYIPHLQCNSSELDDLQDQGLIEIVKDVGTLGGDNVYQQYNVYVAKVSAPKA